MEAGQMLQTSSLQQRGGQEDTGFAVADIGNTLQWI